LTLFVSLPFSAFRPPAAPIFKSDPTGGADEYDVKHGIKTASQVAFEKQQRIFEERAGEVKKHKAEKAASRQERERIKAQIAAVS